MLPADNVAGADYNAFGYDPKGILASVAAFFFGPAWVPAIPCQPPPSFKFNLAPPRYGPPNQQQLPLLPDDFIPELPPCYFGSPMPPYLPGPDRFDRHNFAALLRGFAHHSAPTQSLQTQYRRQIISGLPVGEVKYGVYWVPIYHIIDSERYVNCILSEMIWEDFRDMMHRHLDVDAGQAQLGCRVYVDGYANTSIRLLAGSDDWVEVMDQVGREFAVSNDVELEVLEVNGARIKKGPKVLFQSPAELEMHTYGLLSPRPLMIETHGFIYPSIASDLPEGYAGLDASDIEVAQAAGMLYADDFTLLSPLHLFLSTEIAPAKIIALYFWAAEMIERIQKEEASLIAQMMAFRSILE